MDGESSWWFVTDGDYIWIVGGYEVQSGALVLAGARPYVLSGTSTSKKAWVRNTAQLLAAGEQPVKEKSVGDPADCMIIRADYVWVWRARPEVCALLDALEAEETI